MAPVTSLGTMQVIWLSSNQTNNASSQCATFISIQKKAILIAFFLDLILISCYSITVTFYNYGVKHV